MIGAAPAPARRIATAQRLDRARRTATAQHLERAVRQLRKAGVAVEGGVGGDPDATVAGQFAVDPSEVVVSWRPWVSCVRPGAESGPLV
jgi:hypothetical protein